MKQKAKSPSRLDILAPRKTLQKSRTKIKLKLLSLPPPMKMNQTWLGRQPSSSSGITMLMHAAYDKNVALVKELIDTHVRTYSEYIRNEVPVGVAFHMYKKIIDAHKQTILEWTRIKKNHYTDPKTHAKIDAKSKKKLQEWQDILEAVEWMNESHWRPYTFKTVISWKPASNAVTLKIHMVERALIEEETKKFVNARDAEGKTALMYACMQNKEHSSSDHIFETLFRHGADKYAQDFQGRTALMRAAEQGDIIAVELERPSKNNVQDIHGRTALMYAAMHGHLNIIRAFPDFDKTIKDVDGMTAAAYAIKYGHLNLIKYLK